VSAPARQDGWIPVEKLREVWTPEREIEELTANLEPQTELDSQIRDYFMRIVRQHGSIRLFLDQPNTGNIRWEIVATDPRNGPIRREVTIWWEP
jgi:hypothetical protein